MKLFYFLFFTFLFSFFIAGAQQNLTLYNMPAIQQSMYINPAQLPQCRVNVGLPVYSSVYFNFSNNGFRFVDLVKKDADSLHLTVDNMLSKLHKENFITQSAQMDLISFGFKVKKGYFSFSVIEKEVFSFRYPKDLLNFAWKGNGAFLGQDLNFNLGLNATHYREYGAGYAREINEKLTVGGKLKYLYGMENVQTKQSDFIFNTDPTNFAYTSHANIHVNTSGLDSNSYIYRGINSGNPFAYMTKYLFGQKNSGFGIDLGGVYKYNEKISFSASVIDLGYIRWKTNTDNYVSAHPNQPFKYEGLDVVPYITTGGVNTDSALTALGDTINKTYKIHNTHEKYTSYLPTQIYTGGNYKLSEKQNAGVLLYGQFFQKKLHAGVSLSYNLKVGNWFSVSTGWSYINRDWRNLGLGFAITGPVQWYVVMDNILAFTSIAEVGNKGVPVPASVKGFNIRTGINLCFGRKAKDRDHDGVPDEKDDCPDVKGLKEYKGCPDNDGDGIIDKLDSCPNEKGLAKFNGCPDRDGDGVIDKRDECPDQPGPVELKGCPDKDGDGVIDKRDSCPDVKGPAELNGCPDRDGDGIIDKLDSCPDEKGTPKFYGCPDKDNDGVPDKYDLCPSDSGAVETHGCPDKDGDGVLDKVDRCPDKAGPKENEGCPIAKLHLLDKQGNIIATATIDKDGRFNFTELPADESALLKLESYDVLIVNEVTVTSGRILRIARRGADGFFHFEKLTGDANKMGKLDIPDTQIQLKKEEAEKVQKAMETLEFDFGKETIRSSSFAGLDVLVDLMKQNPGWRLKLSGHTDNVSSQKFNMELSKKRVEMVKKYFVLKGISADRFVLKWYGSSKPIAPNTTEEGKQKNRRVEFLIIK